MHLARRLELALSRRDLGEVDRAEGHALHVAQLLLDRDRLLVQRARPGVVAELEDRVGQVVGRVGDAPRIAHLSMERQARSRGTSGRAEVALHEGQGARAGERIRAQR